MIRDDAGGVATWREAAATDAGTAARLDDRLADRAWGQAEAMRLATLALTTVHWPLAFDWFDADRDPRLHLRRLSIFLSGRPACAPSDGVRRLGSLLAGIRRGAGTSLVDGASDAGIDPVALSFLELGQLRDEEVTTSLLERLAWGMHTTVAHLGAVMGCKSESSPHDQTPRGDPMATGADLGPLLHALSHAATAPIHGVALLGGVAGPHSPPLSREESGRRAVLDCPVACSPMPIGAAGHVVAPTIRPDRRRRAGFAHVVVTVRDREANPVGDVEVRLALGDPSDLPGRDPSAVTDASGIATINDVWLPDLIRSVPDGLRLPLVALP